MASKRASIVPPPPKPPTSLAPTLVIGDHVSFTGTHPITTRDNTAIHPRAKINSTHALVTIGSNCIVSERSSTGLQSAPAEGEPDGVVVEDGVVIEVGAVVEGKRIGEGSIIEVNARIGKGAVLGKHCKIGPLCVVVEGEYVPDFTVIYGYGERRIDNSGIEDLKLKMTGRQIQVLRKIMPPTNLAKYQ